MFEKQPRIKREMHEIKRQEEDEKEALRERKRERLEKLQ
jgi:hypothetical protein